MGNTTSTKKVNFEDIQYLIKKKRNFLLINTLDPNQQECLIKKTLPIHDEVKLINQCLSENKEVNIIVYDKNANAPNLMKKYEQLVNLGFYNVYIYPGGLFEWLCLQDIYGFDEFPTTKKELDILKFKGRSVFTSYMLTNNID